MKDKILSLFKDEEAIEPETIRKLYPNATDFDVLEIMAEKIIKETSASFVDFYVFENIVHILNGMVPDTEKVEGATPEQIWYAVKKIKKMRPDHPPFEHEVKAYIDFYYKDRGIVFRPPTCEIDDPEKNTKFIALIEKKKDVEPVKEDDEIMSRQMIHFLRIEQYIKNKLNG